MKRVVRIVTAGGLMGCSGALLFHFSMIVRYGKFYIQEPNPLVLTGEIVLMGLLFLLGVLSLVWGGK